MSQGNLFDYGAAGDARDDGIARAHEHAPEGWSARAFQAVARVAAEQPEFIVDAVWAYVEEPREGRAMGAVMRAARLAGLIEPTNRYRDSARVTAHRNPRRIWRSAVYRGPGSSAPPSLVKTDGGAGLEKSTTDAIAAGHASALDSAEPLARQGVAEPVRSANTLTPAQRGAAQDAEPRRRGV